MDRQRLKLKIEWSRYPSDNVTIGKISIQISAIPESLFVIDNQEQIFEWLPFSYEGGHMLT